MIISLIGAAAQNGVIGLDNKLPWKLPADMKRFRSLTMPHHIIMGRKTFESIGAALPGRTNIIVTRQKNYRAENCLIAHSIEEAIELGAGDDEIFVIGGAAIYQLALPFAGRIYLTIIHEDFEGDTFLFDIDQTIWKEVYREDFEPDEQNNYAYSFLTLEKRRAEYIPHA